MPPRTARQIIRHLHLVQHPEGGYFCETYRSPEWLLAKDLPPRYHGKRSIATAIYYLLQRGDFSALHRIQSDELWHFHDGVPLEIVMLSDRGDFSKVRLGMDLTKGERPQVCIPRGFWFGAAVSAAGRSNYSLASCTVAPGFDFKDFEMAQRSVLVKKFPQHRREILKWTRIVSEAKVA
jgi:predicted cupin superfamily sugar epimerase